MIRGVTSIGIPRGKTSRKRFIPPPRKIGTVPWQSVSQMCERLKLGPGEWRLSTNQWGHLQGLPHITGMKVAIGRMNKMLLWDGHDKVVEACSSNFVGHNEEAE